MSARNLVPLREVPEHRPWTSARWLKRQVAERRIGAYKVSGKLLIDIDELDRFAEAGRVNPAPSLRTASRLRST